ncbi:hypothetical protein [Moorena sp. SIO3H5]|nr:hypothetical protein [Moorena sp. SIO3H5]
MSEVITINFSTEKNKYYYFSLLPVPCSLFPVPYSLFPILIAIV